MGELAKEVLPINIEDELKSSYLDYAMSVIVGRALPDVRDGLKPVHRRVLHAMNVLGNDWNKPYKKSARVVGDVIGKYHPHGDSAVYDTIVRMAQDFSMRYTLVDGQGNFGSVDGDSAAAMRYTEIRMDKLSHELLADIDKETVNFVPNYDGTEQIPEVMPTRVPNLLINGSSGIAVGMATNIPPHNLNEVVSACLALIDNPALDIDGLMEHIPGPDFPTGAFINGRDGIVEAYRTGRGRIHMRARHHFEENEKNGKVSIVFTEIPYQLNKARLIEKIAELVKEKKIEGITELRDESDKDGMRIVVDLRRGEMPEVTLNNLFSQTALQSVFGINVVALMDGKPQTLNLKQMLEAFVRHRREVVTRRTIYELRKARERGHLLEGLAIALSNIDPIIALIKKSPTGAEAKVNLIATPWSPGSVTGFLERAGENACRPDDLGEEFGMHDGMYHLSPQQAQAILDLRLQKLTGLEHEKLIEEYQQKLEEIKEYLDILGSPEMLLQIIRDELAAIKAEYGDERRTEIIANKRDLTMADLIPEEDLVLTISHGGYAKTQQMDVYQAQRRGGKGKSAASVKDDDYVEHLMIANSHDTVLCFTDAGKVFWLKVYDIPQASRNAKGRPMVNVVNLGEEERITAILPLPEFTGEEFIFMATSMGTVKKTSLEHFQRPRSSGLIACELDEGDHLIGVAITDGTKDILLLTDAGKANRFNESAVRAMGRTARGVRGIRIQEDQKVISLVIPEEGGTLLTASDRGYGKRTLISEFPTKGRGTQGVKAMVVNERNGIIVGAVQVFENDEVMLISDKGTLVRTSADSVSCLGRNTQGVRLIKVAEKERLIGVERVCEPEEVDDGIEYLAADGTQTDELEADVDTLVADDAAPESDDANVDDQNVDDADE
ncbi:MAG: DNA gyrase subunit A [Oleispira antarctica]|uniref:DNA gyrase subunit A n=1 Tax=Oleispira antarctica RB-8 TaxID=698738 RepID=R4YLU8_OLEAN|nr:DNA gyrase subunit A [Oleispira antarctica]MBQ0792132.1 DNA gyrase subunit A [Oleispira antarctica]CCK75565.1 DNA gyrase subunit A [Oleispira antarctica RB-8]